MSGSKGDSSAQALIGAAEVPASGPLSARDVRRLPPAFDVDLVEVPCRDQFGDARPGLAHLHAEVVRQIGRGSHSARPRGDAQQLALGFVPVELPVVVL